MDDARIPTTIEARAIVAVMETARGWGVELTYPQALELVEGTIREMRAPTQEVLDAMMNAVYRNKPGQPGYVSHYTKHRLRWEAAIDAICPAANSNAKESR